MTSRGLEWLKRFLNSDITSLYQCYNNCSVYKHRSFRVIEEHIEHLRKDGYKVSCVYITGYNSSFYSCGYIYFKDSKYWLDIETHCNTFVYEIDIKDFDKMIEKYGVFLW